MVPVRVSGLRLTPSPSRTNGISHSRVFARLSPFPPSPLLPPPHRAFISNTELYYLERRDRCYFRMSVPRRIYTPVFAVLASPIPHRSFSNENILIGRRRRRGSKPPLDQIEICRWEIASNLYALAFIYHARKKIFSTIETSLPRLNPSTSAISTNWRIGRLTRCEIPVCRCVIVTAALSHALNYVTF